MHRIAAMTALVLASCRFDADYDGGSYRCTDGVCPDGLACIEGRCVDPDAEDAGAIDATPDAGPDAAPPDLTCADPGIVVRGVDRTFPGDTTGGTNHVAAMCAGGIHNGPDDVYLAAAVEGDTIRVEITDDTHALRAYVITACAPSPGTCATDMVASDGFALTLTNVTAGEHWIVVDDINPAGGHPYALTVDVGP